jgi:hypothetical protein
MKHLPANRPRPRLHLLAVLTLAVLAACAVPNDAVARDISDVRLAAIDADPIDAGHEALSQGRRPWYDAEADAAQRVELFKPWDAPDFNLLDGTWAQMFAWATLALVVVLLVGGVVYALMSWQRPVDDSESDVTLIPGLATARSELLPVRAGSTGDQLRAEAQRHFAAGEYGEAVVCLYTYGLLTLDDLHMIHLARGKTNRQYLRELARTEQLHEPMRQMVGTFEGYFFGGHDVSRQRCEQCLAHINTIHAARREVTA